MGLTDPQRQNWFKTLSSNFNHANALAKRHDLSDAGAAIETTYRSTNDPSQYKITYLNEDIFRNRVAFGQRDLNDYTPHELIHYP